GGTIFSRTYSSSFASDSRVESTWGSEHNQAPPHASYTVTETRDEESVENGIKVLKKVETQRLVDLPLYSSDVKVALDLQHRQKGLLWYSTYKVAFTGVYTFQNTSDKEQSINFELKFPTAQAIYDNLTFNVDGNPAQLTNKENAAFAAVKVGGGKS